MSCYFVKEAGSQQITHQAYRFDLFFAINYYLIIKIPSILALKFDYFPISLYRVLLRKEIEIVLRELDECGHFRLYLSPFEEELYIKIKKNTHI